MSERKIPNSPTLQIILAAILPGIVWLGYRGWTWFNQKVLSSIGIDLPLSEADVERVINWILSLIIEQEKTKDPGALKFAKVVQTVREQASVSDLRLIAKHFKTPENAVQTVFNKYQTALELKKLNEQFRKP
jgi:hypothetical protein